MFINSSLSLQVRSNTFKSITIISQKKINKIRKITTKEDFSVIN